VDKVTELLLEGEGVDVSVKDADREGEKVEVPLAAGEDLGDWV